MSIEHVVITNISVQDKNKEGTPYVDKRGRNFFRIGIQVDKYPDTWWSDIAYDKEKDKSLNLEKGKEYTLNLTESPDGQYKNFKVASRVDVLEQDVALLKEGMRVIKSLLKKEAETKQKGYEYPENKSEEVPFEDKGNDINPEEIYF